MDAFTNADAALADFGNIILFEGVRGKPLATPAERLASGVAFQTPRSVQQRCRNQQTIDDLLPDAGKAQALDTLAESILANVLNIWPDMATYMGHEEMLTLIKGHLTGEKPLF